MRGEVIALSCCIALVSLAPCAGAQELEGGAVTRGPRFFLASTSSATPVRVDVKRSPVLSRRLALDLRGVPLETALETITREAGLKLSYSKTLIPLGKPVRLVAEDITVAGAISSVLFDVDVDVVFTTSGQAVLVPRGAPPAIEVAGTIAGRVTDSTGGEGVARVQVNVVGTALGRVTDDNGRYTIAGVPAGRHEITARRVGYAAQTLGVTVLDGANVTADFVLSRAPTLLTGIVNTATGQQERYKVGNAIASMTADVVMKEAPVNNLNDLLSGRVPGLQVYTAGGYTGATSLMRIRGTNSINVSNDPIVIIDGVRIEGSPGINAPLGTTSVSGTFRQFRPGRLADLSMYEIESIDVVKGPSAATLYGSDAANGVIVIRTKRGAAGTPRWRLWGEVGQSRPEDHFKPGYWAYGTNTTTGVKQQCVLIQVAANVCRQDSVVTWNPLEDAATTPMATGTRSVYGTQVSGGVQNFTYFLSGEASGETGFLHMPDAEQERIKQLRGVSSIPEEQIRPNYVDLLNLRANVGTGIGQNAHVQVSSGLVFNTTSIPGAAIYQAGAFYNAAPTVNGGWFGNRPGEQFAMTSAENTSRVTSSLGGDYQPSGWLSTRATVGLDASGSSENSLQKNGEGPTTSATGQIQRNRYDLKVWSVDLSATATRDLRSGLASRSTIGAQYNRRRENVVSAYGSNLAPGAITMAGAATRTAEESTTETIVAGTFLEQTFSFNDRLFINGGLRFDGGSAFGSAFKTIAYPKASVSWLAADGGPGIWPRWIDNLRVRAAVGSSGVQPGAVASLQRDCLASAFVNGVAVTGATLCQLGNSRLKPEKQTEYETGLDGELLQSRIKLELTLYQRQSEGAISSIPVAPSAGTITQIGGASTTLTIPVNLGSVRNRGIEATINSRVLDWRASTLDLGVSGNLNENRLLKLGQGVTFTPTSTNQPGYPLNSRFERRYTYKDADGNGIITDDEVTVDAAPGFMGTVHPQHVATGTATLGLMRETLRLSAMGDFRDAYAVRDVVAINNCIFNTCAGAADPKASLEMQAAVRARAKTGTFAGFYHSGRHLALREISASYTVPQGLAARMRARSAQLSLSARNVAVLLTNYTGYSIESVQSIPTDNLGPQNPGAPMPRYWIMRLTLDY